MSAQGKTTVRHHFMATGKARSTLEPTRVVEDSLHTDVMQAHKRQRKKDHKFKASLATTAAKPTNKQFLKGRAVQPLYPREVIAYVYTKHEYS